MSDAEGALSDRDRMILDASTQDPEQEESGADAPDDEVQERLSRLEKAVDGLQSTVDGQQDTIDEQSDVIDDQQAEIRRLKLSRDQLQEDLNRLRRKAGDIDLSHEMLIEPYVHMVEDGNEDLVDGSMRRAVCLHRHWDEWVRKMGAGDSQRFGLSTKMRSKRKHSPGYVKVKLEDELGESLASEQVKRAMKMLAQKSVTDEDDLEIVRDANDRKHITGGEYEFHERTNVSNEADTTFFVLVKA